MTISRSLLAVAAGVALATSAQAVSFTQAYATPNDTPGVQSWTGTLGLDFQVTRAITVSAVGVFDSTKTGVNDLYLTFFNADGSSASPVFGFFGTGNPGGTSYVFRDVTPFVLAPGTYQLAAWGFRDGQQNYNAGVAGAFPGLVTFDGAAGTLVALGTRYADAGITNVLASNADVGATRYGSATFVYSPSAIPEPGSWAMILAGFALVGVGMRRKAAATA